MSKDLSGKRGWGCGISFGGAIVAVLVIVFKFVLPTMEEVNRADRAAKDQEAALRQLHTPSESGRKIYQEMKDAPGDAATGPDALDGEWDAVYSESDGEPVGEAVVKDVSLEVADGELTIRAGPLYEAGAVTIDAAGTPPAVDLTISDANSLFGHPPARGSARLGIYKRKGDVLMLCWSRTGGKDRPRDFTTKKGDGCEVVVYQRKQK
jgi:uncharacterized protein (TIGR03067 family)